LDVAECKLTFFDLDPTAPNERLKLFKELKEIGVESYLDVKQVWLKKVLEENEMDKDQIDAIIKFRAKQK